MYTLQDLLIELAEETNKLNRIYQLYLEARRDLVDTISIRGIYYEFQYKT